MTKPGWLKDAVAKADGYYSPKGEKLKSAKLSQEQQDAWNGVKKAAPKKAEVVEEVAEEKPAPKKEGRVAKAMKKAKKAISK